MKPLDGQILQNSILQHLGWGCFSRADGHHHRCLILWPPVEGHLPYCLCHLAVHNVHDCVRDQGREKMQMLHKQQHSSASVCVCVCACAPVHWQPSVQCWGYLAFCLALIKEQRTALRLIFYMRHDTFGTLPFTSVLLAKWQPYNVPTVCLISPKADTTEFMPAGSAV